MLETLFGGLLGGIFRILPEAMKLFDRANERKHELAMVQSEMEFAKIRGEIAMRETEATMTVAELDAMTEALKGQASMAKAGGKFVSAISALVRPIITYWFVGLYSAYKIAGMVIAHEQGARWLDILRDGWSVDDMAMLNLILTFWFVGRVWERTKH